MPASHLPQTISGAFGELLISPDTGGRSAPHYHLAYAIGVARSGGGNLFALDRWWSYSTNMVVVTNPLDPHWGRPSATGLDYCLLYPEPTWLMSLSQFKHIPLAPRFDRAVIDDPITATALLFSFDRVIQDGDESYLAAAVALLFRQHARSSASENRPHAANSIASLAVEAGLSRAYHSRKYRKIVGLSPLHHRRQQRVAAAQSMIAAGAALADTAVATGFADQAHMTRQFRQILGVTPLAYRRR